MQKVAMNLLVMEKKINHLVFMDDWKLYAKSEKVLIRFFDSVGLCSVGILGWNLVMTNAHTREGKIVECNY